jgi:hypothetical protein
MAKIVKYIPAPSSAAQFMQNQRQDWPECVFSDCPSPLISFNDLGDMSGKVSKVVAHLNELLSK